MGKYSNGNKWPNAELGILKASGIDCNYCAMKGSH